MVLYEYQTESTTPEEKIEMRQNMFQSLKHRLENERKNIRKNITMDDINDMLIQMYDNDHQTYITTGNPIDNLDEIWESEVHQFRSNTSINQKYLDGLITGIG